MSKKALENLIPVLAAIVFVFIVAFLFGMYKKTKANQPSELQKKQEQVTMYDFCMSIENPTRDPLKVNCEEYLQE